MVDIDPTVALIATTLRIPPGWLTFPSIITNLILPMILMGAGFYFFLNNKLRIFQYSIVNLIIAAIMAFLLLPFSQITIYLALVMIAFTGIQLWSNRIFFFAIVLSFYFLISGSLRMMLYTIAGGGLIGILFNRDLMIGMRIILIAGIILGLYFLLPYVPNTYNIFGLFG